MRALTALLLSLMLALASVSMAVARGQAPMGPEIELCTDAGAVTVRLDAEGNPMPDGPHLCPDCLSASTAFVMPEAGAIPAPHITIHGVEATTVVQFRAGLTRRAAQARGPPLFSV
jgi:hypothetical protein